MFKKACILGTSAIMLINLSLSNANAVNKPTSTTKGKLLGSSNILDESEFNKNVLLPELVLKKKIKYTSYPMDLIDNPNQDWQQSIRIKDKNNQTINISDEKASEVVMYLRVVKEGEDDTSKDWILVRRNGHNFWVYDTSLPSDYWANDKVGISKLQRTDIGKYNVYYYIDGGTDYDSTESDE